ncbi:thiamine-phosphate kinase [Psychromonas sp. Urea-02u-13]|uniref:thiamine-phosphate kinase n=1 Tax=Psychromonas sp. Urea-02u-13 TaxID=2058326 RepID=UPI000C325A3A|nr:thiamine-phosphate kinase [Psychromonas sp. Urea-02u-13]PKG37589.1 thiamine-phosphate kinase [Psychromonas sp. Urea-02u-13]
MSLGEFDLIKRYFKQAALKNTHADVVIGIGDDCAILDVPEGYQLAVTTDSLVAGVHFFEDVCAYRLGYKSLAVNLSDLAAMGALPKWVSLAITLPSVDEKWLSEFSRGFFELANKHNISLIGGDTTKGPLSITVSAKGIVPRQKALLRSGANVGDLICVSSVLGNGALGLASKLDQMQLKEPDSFVDALELTEPRNELGVLLTHYASSCIDISDGLLQDLGHIVEASQCCATVKLETLPLSIAMQKEIEHQTLSLDQALHYALTGGDDYELLFTINEQHYKQLILQTLPVAITVIGEVVEQQSQKIQLTNNDESVSSQLSGWDHFKQN